MTRKNRFIGCLILLSASFFALTGFNFNRTDSNRLKKKYLQQNLNFTSQFAADTIISEGHQLLSSSDCFGCHGLYREVAAPSYSDVAEKYKNDRNAVTKLTNKIITGGKGVWGTEREMNPHPGLLREDVEKMVKFILSLNSKGKSQK